jgi:hypothetical protein
VLGLVLPPPGAGLLPVTPAGEEAGAGMLVGETPGDLGEEVLELGLLLPGPCAGLPPVTPAAEEPGAGVLVGETPGDLGKEVLVLGLPPAAPPAGLLVAVMLPAGEAGLGCAVLLLGGLICS